VRSLLTELRDQLAAAAGDPPPQQGITPTLSLLRNANAFTVARILAPLLFQSPVVVHDSGNIITGEQALQLLGCLVQSDAPRYLKPASRAIRDESERLFQTHEQVHVSLAFLDVLVQQLSGADATDVAENAAVVVRNCCRIQASASLAETVCTKIVAAWRVALLEMPNHKEKASICCVRCASTIVDIALLDDEVHLSAALSSGALPLLLDMLTGDSVEKDPLLLMSLLDLLEKLALHRPLSANRARWLTSPPVVRPVLQLAGAAAAADSTMMEVEPDPILGGPALRVVGALCPALVFLEDDDGDGSPTAQQLLQSFHRALHNFDTTAAGAELDRLCRMDAISSFAAASDYALSLVLDDSVTRDAWLSLKVAQSKLQSAILVSVARVLDPVVSQNTDAGAGDPQMNSSSAPSSTVASSSSSPPSPALKMKLVASLGQVNGSSDPTDLLLSLARSPLPETRLGAYALLEAIAKLGTTGGQMLFTNGDFFEFVVDRNRESTKEGREAKYAVVQALLNSPVRGLLAPDIVGKLEQYVAKGPHYVQTLSWEVAEQ